MSIKTKAGYCSVAVVLALVATNHEDELRTSAKGLELLADYEDCRTQAYKDIVGVPTCGIGSTTGVHMGMVWTEAEVAAAFVRDVKVAEQCVNTFFNGRAMPQPVFDAVTSLVFNAGCWGTRWNTKLNKPTGIARYAESGDWTNTCYRLGDFIYAGGKVSNGLKNRRTREQAHCMTWLQPQTYEGNPWVPNPY